MVLYLMDYKGTLDTFEDPVSFFGALRDRHEGNCLIVVMSGSEVPDLLVESADLFWKKPVAVEDLLGLHGQGVTRAIISDDFAPLSKAYCRILTRIGFTVVEVDPGDLLTLLL